MSDAAALNDRLLDRIREAGFGVNPGETAEYVLGRVLSLAVPETAGKVWFSRWQVERHANKAMAALLGRLLDAADEGRTLSADEVAEGRAVLGDVRLLLPDVPTPETEAIVRALAASAGPNPITMGSGAVLPWAPIVYDDRNDPWCIFCGVESPLTGREVDLCDPSAHQPDCPWRLSREWVAQHPEEKT